MYSLLLIRFEEEFYYLPLIPITIAFLYNGWVFFSIFDGIFKISRIVRIVWMYILYFLLLLSLLMIAGVVEVLASRI
jgi:hypothetical protein